MESNGADRAAAESRLDEHRRMMMSNVDLYGGEQSVTAMIGISAEERKRESALRERFASFWGTASRDLRAVYHVFISATPLADGISLEIADEMDVHG